MSDNRRERLVIPVSDSIRDVKFVEIELQFDEPTEFQGERWNTYYYTVVNKADGQEYSLAATAGLHRKIQETGAVRGTVLSLGRIGEGKSTVWDVSVIGGSPPTGSPTTSQPHQTHSSHRSRAVAQSSGPPVWRPYTQEQVNVMTAIADDYLDLWEMMLVLVASRERLADVSPEQQARLATALSIHSNRVYKPGMVIGGATPEETAEAVIEAAMGTDNIVDVLLDTIVEITSIDDRKTLITLLREFGISSETVRANSLSENVNVLDAIKLYCELIDDGTSEDGAKFKVAQEYEFDYADPLF